MPTTSGIPASPAMLAVGLVGAVVIFFLAWRRPTIALTVWLIVGTVLSEYVLFPGAAVLHIHLSRVILFALAFGLAAGWVPRTTRREASVTPVVLIVILTAWTIVSAAWMGTLFREDGTKNLSVFLTGFFVPAMVMYFARYFPLSLKVARTVCGLLTILLVYMIFTAFAEHFHLDALVFPSYILDPSLGIHTERARGPIVNAAENGGMIAILLLIGLHWVLYTTTGLMRWICCLCLLISGALALFFAETRGPWLAFLGGLFVMLWHKQGRGLMWALGCVAGVALTAFLVVTAASVGNLAKKDPLPQRSDNTSETAEFRMELYRESVRPFEEHPLIGWGLGTFTDVDDLFDAYGGNLTLSVAVLHDTVVAVTLESGIIGGALYLAFLGTLTFTLLKLRKASPSFEARDFQIVGVASIVAFVINGLFVDVRYFWQQNALVYFVAGLGLALPQVSRLRIADSVAPSSSQIEPSYLRSSTVSN